MTSEEIKETIPIRDIFNQYGISINHSGMCCCPFHGEKHPSMKVYKDSFNCFACGVNGDIFTLVQFMDNCDFKTAFLSLGGEYENTTKREKKVAELSRSETKRKQSKTSVAEAELKVVMIATFDRIKDSLKNDAPFSDRWCESNNMLPIVQNWWDLWTTGEEINVLNVYTKCQQFNKRYDSLSRSNAGTVSAGF